MAYGIEVTNDHGTVLIDDSYSNLAVRHQGTLSAGAGLRTVSVPGLDQPVPAVRSTAYAATASRQGSTGYIWSAGGAQVHWYVFDTPTSSGDYGLQVFNAAGQLTFDAYRKYARVRSVQSGVGSQTYDSGRLYAVATLSPARRRRVETRPDPTPGSQLVFVDLFDEQVCARVNGATVQTAWQTIIAAPGLSPQDPGTVPQGWSDNAANAQFAIIDVTGY